MVFNQYSLNKIKKLISKGQEAYKDGLTLDDLARMSSFGEYEFYEIGFENPDYTVPTPRWFYRIGEPIEDGYGSYKYSYNFCADERERGISVVTTDWLQSLKSIFFGTSDDIIAAKGVYKVYGFELPYRGGDDEPLICPLDWAVKTRIRSRYGLYKAVKKEEKTQSQSR